MLDASNGSAQGQALWLLRAAAALAGLLLLLIWLTLLSRFQIEDAESIGLHVQVGFVQGGVAQVFREYFQQLVDVGVVLWTVLDVEFLQDMDTFWNVDHLCLNI